MPEQLTAAAGEQTHRFPPGHNRLQSLLSSLTFLKDPIGTITRNMQIYGGTYSGYLMGSGRFIITEDPDFIQYILRENHSNYEKSALSTKSAARLFGRGLLFSNGETWLHQRRLIQPAFHHGKIQSLSEIVASTARDFVQALPEEENVDMYRLTHKLSFKVLVHSLFDIDLSEETIQELSAAFTDLQDFLFKEINQPFRKLFYPITQADRIILRKSSRIKEILKRIIDDRKAAGESHHDLLDMLLQVRYEDSGLPMEEDQLIDEISVLLFAGHETTANTLSWLFYLLGEHPQVARKLRTSLDQTDLLESPKNELLLSVISESMRLYPAAWMTERVAIKDDQFKDFRFPKGTIIIPFFFGLHRSEKFWYRGKDFIPERFMSSDPVKNRKVKNFFPFGAGPRLCIGNNFALLEMSIIVHVLLTQFEISSAQGVPELWPLITLRPKKLYLGLKRVRQKAWVGE